MKKALVPRFAFFVSGTGKHDDRLQAFDKALLSAGPLAHNLVSVSSIFPAGCKVISAQKGFSMLTPGQITFCIMARQETNQFGDVASAAVGLAIKNNKNFGYISEYHGAAKNVSEAKLIAEKLAKEMFARKISVDSENLKLEMIQATSASITCDKKNEWVCAVALCIFVL